MKGLIFALLIFTSTYILKAQADVPYIEEEISVYSTMEVTLSGTLTLPPGTGPFPCAILITGSGPQDRNEELFGHKPFEAIAHGLAAEGIATIRMDDRGVGKSTGDFSKATSLDFANDIQRVFKYASQDKRLLPNKIGLIGHSEGGMIAPIVASRNPNIAFVISLAGTGVPGREVLRQQNYDIYIASGGTKEQAQGASNNIVRFLDIVKNNTDSTTCADKLTIALDSALADQKGLIPDWNEFLKYQIGFLTSPWMRFFAEHDPAEDWKLVKCPVLALNGEKDIQVNPNQNLPAISAALDAGKNYNYEMTIMNGMNHLFQRCVLCTVDEYAHLPESISPDVILEMGNWVNKKVR
ncbi:MAG: alpha/beta hydrolase family protein [Flavobacteriales bacterium]